MKRLLLAIAVLCSAIPSYSQGQVLFANRVVDAGLDAPVFIMGTQQGPGPDWTAQLFVVGPVGSLTPLIPTSTFQAAGTGADAILDRYWNAQVVEVPGVTPGNNVTFRVRAWLTSAGSFDAAQFRAESADFTVTVGGGVLPPANLATLQGFTVFIWPEPSTLVLGIIGGVIVLLWQRR
jgi:hypothetical protein